MGLMNASPGSRHVSGHEHALQYARGGSSHFIVSGSGAKVNHVKKKGLSRYAEPVTGYVKLDIMKEGTIVFSFVHAEMDQDWMVTCSDTIRAPQPAQDKAEESGVVSFDSVVVRASSKYRANPWRMRMLGENYRQEWYQQIEVPVFNIASEHGGLEIVQ